MKLGDVAISWQTSFHEGNKMPRAEGKKAVALSAFTLSSLPSAQLRKQQLKEMWESGADVIVRNALPWYQKICLTILYLQVLIDHNTVSGFECIAEAREALLAMGRKEMDEADWDSTVVRGCHVVAPVSISS
jgi:hypothetical protein